MYRYSMMTYRYISVDFCTDSVPIVTVSSQPYSVPFFSLIYRPLIRSYTTPKLTVYQPRKVTVIYLQVSSTT